MKVLVILSVLFVASAYSRQIVIRREIVDDSAQENPIIIQTDPQPQPKQQGNIISDLFRKAAQITSATAEGVGNIAQGALQGTASFGQGVVNGAQKAISGALENTGDVAAKFSNGVEHEVDNWWNALAQK
ncbi:hypothetical protein WA026_014401 [Henosepilachna vigintioctopunctata]|uniref:Uncharacterized protein n=1 Tax=Henosepilachna vigintioctopunctata TaxID=420089 RepID=A0AAW1UMN9_9CUCU